MSTGTRSERRAAAAARREELIDQVLAKLVEYLKEHTVKEAYCLADGFLNTLIREEPQRKSEIVHAALEARRRLSAAILKKVAKKEASHDSQPGAVAEASALPR